MDGRCGLNATGIGTLVLDNGLNIRWFTPAIQSLYRCRTGDVGRPLVEMQPLSDDPYLLQEAELVLGGLDFSEREVEGQSKRWFKRRIQPCLTTDGLMDGVVMTFVDITDQRQIYAALAAAENRAQLATVAKSRFLAVASHDLRQPAAAIWRSCAHSAALSTAPPGHHQRSMGRVAFISRKVRRWVRIQAARFSTRGRMSSMGAWRGATSSNVPSGSTLMAKVLRFVRLICAGPAGVSMISGLDIVSAVHGDADDVLDDRIHLRKTQGDGLLLLQTKKEII